MVFPVLSKALLPVLPYNSFLCCTSSPVLGNVFSNRQCDGCGKGVVMRRVRQINYPSLSAQELLLSPLTCHTPWVTVQVYRYVSSPFLVSGDLHLILSSATIFCKESACTTGDVGLLPRLGRFPGGGHGNPRQYSCLENPMDRGAWRATVHGVAKSQTQLKRQLRHAQFPSLSVFCSIF